MENGVSVVIMAAGEGTRMKSKVPKMLHTVCGKTILDYVLAAAADLTEEPPVVVVGHGGDAVRARLGEHYRFALQKERLGTGHAVMMAAPYLENTSGYVVVLAGDTPLIQGSTLKKLLQYTKDYDFHGVALSAAMEDPTGYGRILREKDLSFRAIVEHKDANETERQVKEVNASMYCFDTQALLSALQRLKNENAQNEYYLTDVLSILKSEGKRVGVYQMEDPREMMGVNTRVQLAEAEAVMRMRINEGHMLNGVTLIDPSSTYIGPDVQIGEDTTIYPGNVLEGSTVIAGDCVLYPNNRLVDATIGSGVKLQASVVLESTIGDETTVGPYAYIRPGCTIGRHVRIGDFVEVKNAAIGEGTKVSHLTYIGDATLGKGINVGCGVVCVNYDGSSKHKTTIGDHAFIGCNVNLVAPVEVEADAYVAAGSTITERVPSKSLAIARARQVNKEGWVDKRRR